MIRFEVTPDCNWLRLVHYDEEIEVRQLKLSFQRFAKNYFFHPKYKKKDAAGNRIWDGKINFFLNNQFLQVGLWGELYRVAKEFRLDIKIDGLDRVIDNTLTLDEFREWSLEFFKDGIGGDPAKKPRDYQIEAAFNIVKFRFSTMELATNAGKTVIVFMALAYMKQTGRATNALIIVPNTNLVLQGIDDFAIYGSRKLGMRMQGVYSGSPDAQGDYVFGTYQSLREWGVEELSRFTTVFVDECHTTDTMSVKKIMAMCKGSGYRFGLSGTIVGDGNASFLTVEGALGPQVMKVTPDDLFKLGAATPVEIKIVRMQYMPEDDRKRLAELRSNKHDIDGRDLYNIERKIVLANPARFRFVCDFISRTTKNALVLFQSVEEGYGRRIYEKLKELTTKEVFYVDGDITAQLREEYKTRMKTGEDRVLVATFKTFSTGISIDNIHSIFFVESYKSEIIIKQSIGRGMRKHAEKDKVTIVDFVDDFSYKGKDNYLMEHSKERERIYQRDKYPYKVYEVKVPTGN